jgi:hypothetical protein
MTVTSMVVGATSATTARLNAKITGSSVGFAVADNPAMTGAVLTANVAVNSYNAATIEVTGLAPGTRYWWRGRDGGVTDATFTGQLLTEPAATGEPGSFTIAMSGDAGLSPMFRGVSGPAPQRQSNAPIYDLLRQRALAEDWIRFCHWGDRTYYDLGSGNHGLSAAATLAQYLSMDDDLFANPRQHELYRSVPITLKYDDHDHSENDGTSLSVGSPNARHAYRLRWPSGDLPAGDTSPIYEAWQTCRVQFIALDTRGARVTGSTMLGAAQLAWLENLLATTPASALVLASPTPWIGAAGGDTWSGFPTERAVVAEMLGDYGWLDRMWFVTADVHANGIGTGATNPYGGFPLLVCGALDADWSNTILKSEYDQFWRNGRNQYATLRVDDRGGDIAMTATLWQQRRAQSWRTITVHA